MSENPLSLVSSVSTPSQNQQLETISVNHNLITLTEIERLAVHYAESGLFGIGKQAQAQCIVKMLAGKELGIAPFTAITGIYIIQGRLTLSAHLMAVLVKKSKIYNCKIKEHTDLLCSIEFFENGESQGISTFTLDDAKKAGLVTDTKLYGKYAKNMLYSRAMSNGAKWYCPLVFGGGVYTPDEIPQDQHTEQVIEIENETIKSDFIFSLRKIDIALAEVTGQVVTQCNPTLLSLAELKLEIESRSDLLKYLLIKELTSSKQPKEKLEQMTVVDLYTLYSLPTTK